MLVQTLTSNLEVSSNTDFIFDLATWLHHGDGPAEMGRSLVVNSKQVNKILVLPSAARAHHYGKKIFQKISTHKSKWINFSITHLPMDDVLQQQTNQMH